MWQAWCCTMEAENTEGIHSHEQGPRSTTGVGQAWTRTEKLGKGSSRQCDNWAQSRRTSRRSCGTGKGGEMRNSKMLSSCSCSFRQQERRAEEQKILRLAAKWKRHYPIIHRKLLRPTNKELHLHFQVTKIGCIKETSQVTEKEQHVMKHYRETPALRAFTTQVFCKPQLPQGGSNSGRVQETTYMVCFSLFFSFFLWERLSLS